MLRVTPYLGLVAMALAPLAASQTTCEPYGSQPLYLCCLFADAFDADTAQWNSCGIGAPAGSLVGEGCSTNPNCTGHDWWTMCCGAALSCGEYGLAGFNCTGSPVTLPPGDAQ